MNDRITTRRRVILDNSARMHMKSLKGLDNLIFGRCCVKQHPTTHNKYLDSVHILYSNQYNLGEHIFAAGVGRRALPSMLLMA